MAAQRNPRANQPRDNGIDRSRARAYASPAFRAIFKHGAIACILILLLIDTDSAPAPSSVPGFFLFRA
jgi:hypothetical protein